VICQRPAINHLIIISGGQTGADRAALDWAIASGIPHEGWCPRGRRAEDGLLDARYLLKETLSANYLHGTEWNVRNSQATVLFCLAPKLTGGSLKTAALARKHCKLLLHLTAAAALPHGQVLRDFVAVNRIQRLNVAGPRASKEPGVAAFVREVLDQAFVFTPAKMVNPGIIK